MRRSASEKLEIIRLVENSELGVKRTLEELGINRSTFYEWYRNYLENGFEGLKPKVPNRKSFWNKIPDRERNKVVELALENTELSPRELAYHITDNQGWFISESSVYRILKERGLITSPAWIVMAAADEYKDKTTCVHQQWQTDFSAPGSDHLSNERSPPFFQPVVEILPHQAREVWWKGVVKFYSVLRVRRNKQNNLKCTGDSPFAVGWATKESMMRQRSLRRKPLYLVCNPLIKKWLWRNVVSSYGLEIARRGVLISVVGYPHSHYPEPPGVEHVI
jgi:transposase